MKKQPKLDLIGQQFNLLTVLDVSLNTRSHAMAYCECKCGGFAYSRVSDIVRGHTQSCGCLSKHKPRKSKSGVEWDTTRKKFRAYVGQKTIGFFYEEAVARSVLKVCTDQKAA